MAEVIYSMESFHIPPPFPKIPRKGAVKALEQPLRSALFNVYRRCHCAAVVMPEDTFIKLFAVVIRDDWTLIVVL